MRARASGAAVEFWDALTSGRVSPGGARLPVFEPALSAADIWTDIPYNVPNLRIENGPAKAHVRIGWLLSVANIYHGFAIQTFTDELAHRAVRDPVEYLLELIGSDRTINFKGVDYPNYGAYLDTYPWETGRLRRVTELVAEKSGWAKRKLGKGAGIGIAAHRVTRSVVEMVTGKVKTEASQKRCPWMTS